MKNIMILFVLAGFLSCNQGTENNNQNKKKRTTIESNSTEVLLAMFPVVRRSNQPIHFYNKEGDIEQSSFDSIIQNSLSASMIEEISFQVEAAKYQAGIQFPLGENYIACVLNTNESWYKKQSLLLFNKQRKIYEKVIPLSQFYGGDGGQIVNESWLYVEDNQTYLYAKESSHTMVMAETSGEPVKKLEESSSLYLWNGNSFEKTSMKDSTLLAEKFELKWEW